MHGRPRNHLPTVALTCLQGASKMGRLPTQTLAVHMLWRQKMFNQPTTPFFLLLVATLVLGGWLIYFGLKWRAASDKTWIAKTNAQSVLKSAPTPGIQATSLIYGVFQDFTNTSAGMVVRDGSDAVVGRIIYNTGDTTIEVGHDTYRTFNESGEKLHITLRPLDGGKARKAPVAECRRSSLRHLRFQDPSTPDGLIDLHEKIGEAHLLLNDRVIGQRWELSKTVVRGRALALQADVPLVLQMFILAAPGSTRGVQL